MLLLGLTLMADDLWTVMSDRLGKMGGAYVLRGVDADGMPVSIPRVLRVDPAGTLYIGKSSDLKGRVIHLKQCLNGQANGHQVAKRLDSHKGLSDVFPAHRLTVDLHGVADPREAERELLGHYFRVFGESPPLNQIG